jgi:hypothetical protein
MANSLLTVDLITKEALMIAHEKATFISTVNREYDDQFAKEGGGGKIGSSLRIRNPNAYTRRTGSRVMDVQDQDETSQTLTVATQDGVDMRFNSAELALSIEDFSQRYIEPAVSVLVSGIDGDFLTAMTKATYNTTGTAGTVVGSSSGDISAIGNARARLNQGLAPKDQNRALQLDSVTMAAIVNGNKAIFNPVAGVEKAFLEGYYGRALGADWYENERTWALTNGSDVTATTESASTLPAADSHGGYVSIDMHSTTTTIVVGDVFTVAGVYACHPETKASLGFLQQFTHVTAGAGATTFTVSPTIYLTGARQNVCKSTGAALATTDFNSQTVTFIGSASTSYRQNLMYHRDAFSFVTADLPLMADAASCVRKNKDGLSLRVWKGSDIRNDELLMRIDILYGWKALRPEWACRITN